MKRKPEYLLLFPDGRFLYVSADSENYSYESFRLFVGYGAELREVPITKVERFRDGGTTYIYTSQGTLYSPRRLSKEAKPTWNDVELERLDATRYNIVENATLATVSDALDGGSNNTPG